jgi:hypothetical protein
LKNKNYMFSIFIFLILTNVFHVVLILNFVNIRMKIKIVSFTLLIIINVDYYEVHSSCNFTPSV